MTRLQYIFPVLVFCAEKNLATLPVSTFRDGRLFCRQIEALRLLLARRILWGVKKVDEKANKRK
jgi:hypothetical protein